MWYSIGRILTSKIIHKREIWMKSHIFQVPDHNNTSFDSIPCPILQNWNNIISRREVYWTEITQTCKPTGTNKNIYCTQKQWKNIFVFPSPTASNVAITGARKPYPTPANILLNMPTGGHKTRIKDIPIQRTIFRIGPSRLALPSKNQSQLWEIHFEDAIGNKGARIWW